MVALKYFIIIIALTNSNSVPVVSGLTFPPTFRPIGLHFHAPEGATNHFSSKCSRLQGGKNIDSNGSNDSLNNELASKNDKRKGNIQQAGENERRKGNFVRMGDNPSMPSTRAKMKKVTSSSRSTLLTPPAILPSLRHGTDGRRWASNLKQHQGVRKSILPCTDDAKNGTSFQSDKKKGKNSENQITPIPITAKKVSSHPDSSLYDTSDHLLDCLPPPSKGSIADLQIPNSSFSETSLRSGSHEFSPSAIEGVLPVSELFYRSTQTNVDIDGSQQDGVNLDKRNDKEVLNFATLGDQASMPRSAAETSSPDLSDVMAGISIGMEGNKFPSEVVWRELNTMAEQEQEEQRQLDLRVQQERLSVSQKSSNGFAAQERAKISINPGENSSSLKNSSPSGLPSKGAKSGNRKSKFRSEADGVTGRKMVRRGMEMLVGGEPINADPPQRSIELNYFRKHPKLWARAITINSPDFGPLLHMHSAGKVGKEGIGLFCENFVDAAQKWGICPDQLNSIVSEQDRKWRENPNTLSLSETDALALIESVTLFEASNDYSFTANSYDSDDAGKSLTFNEVIDFGSQKRNRKKRKVSSDGISFITSDISVVPSASAQESKEDCLSPQELGAKSDERLTFSLGGELKFSLGISRSEVAFGHGSVFCGVLQEGIGLSINADEMGLDVQIAKLVIVDIEGGSTDVAVQFQLYPRNKMGMSDAKRTAKEVNGALVRVIDDGKMAMTLADVAGAEERWSVKIRNRIVEEFLFETEDDKEEYGAINADPEVHGCEDYDGPFVMEGGSVDVKDDIWPGGVNGGLLFDGSKSNSANTPLGPHLVHAAIERAIQNQPRVIVIGDVHGCIDELKALLKKCDYHPGDAIVFLGDLVCKGPDSLSVVQMAREIGAIGVRGNHDFEVVRWHQAIKSGADPPVIGSEHYYVASALSSDDLKWMYNLPWFISSSHLNALFVHAGFVSGIRLAKQNPRLMMNMRSILPDGTVTSKFFNNWPWARLWDGPQTVFFGHDADRGLQQYEHAIGLDTGCVYGGKLTACILPERRLVSVNAKREYFHYRRKHFD